MKKDPDGKTRHFKDPDFRDPRLGIPGLSKSELSAMFITCFHLRLNFRNAEEGQDAFADMILPKFESCALCHAHTLLLSKDLS